MEKAIKEAFPIGDANFILEALTRAGFQNFESFNDFSREDIKEELRHVGITGPKLLKFMKLFEEKQKVSATFLKKRYPGLDPLYQQVIKAKNEKELEIRRFISDNSDRKFNDLTAKTVIMLGETGAGKSTLIDAMCNFLLGVKYLDPYRYKIVVDPPKKSTYASQTSETIAYNLINYGVGYMVKIIDTPGFGDTAGLPTDRANKEKIHAFLKGLERIDLVCFVAKANETRLTIVQRFIIDEVLTIFGKDATNNIVMMFTFCDAGHPQTAGAMQQANVPFDTQFKFNNSALLVPPSLQELTTEMYWEIGNTSLIQFFDKLRTAEGFSLTMTKDVIKERERLSVIIDGLAPKVDNQLCIMAQLRKTEEDIKLNSEEIDKNQYYTETIQVEELISIPCPTGCYTTYCEECRATCHKSCAILRKEDKHGCVAMSAGNCKVCPGKCHYLKHLHYEKIIQKTLVKKMVEQTPKKIKYDQAMKDKKFSEKLLDTRKEDLAVVEREIKENIIQMRDCKVRLAAIALKEYNTSTAEYIKLLIQNEKSIAMPGCDERINELEKLYKKEQLYAKDHPEEAKQPNKY